MTYKIPLSYTPTVKKEILISYSGIPGLSNELKCKLDAIRPAGFGQAQRIPGMTQAALAAILIYLKKKEMDRLRPLKHPQLSKK